MAPNIRMVATDIDGTFVHDDYSYDVARFERLLERMHQAGCAFVVASGNQFWQLRDLFPGHDAQIAYVADNGGYIVDKGEVVFRAEAPRAAVERVLDLCLPDERVRTIMCGEQCAYAQRGDMSPEFFEFARTWYHRLAWADDLRAVDDHIIKFAQTVPDELTWDYVDSWKAQLNGLLEPTSSGHGGIDLIVPGCHKAWGLSQLAERWGIAPTEVAAFGDNNNDIEMLEWAGVSYAVEGATEGARAAAKRSCPGCNDDGVLSALEELFG